MWTLLDDYIAWGEGWWVGPNGIVGDLAYVAARALEGSDLHARAIQHVALCALTNTNPEVQSMEWTAHDQDKAMGEGWWIEEKQLVQKFYFRRTVSDPDLRNYLHENAKQGSLLHIKALRNIR